MRVIAAMLAAGPVAAQDPVMDVSELETCQRGAASPHACIGEAAAQCIETAGGGGAVQGYCYEQELAYWDGRLNDLYADAIKAADRIDASGTVPSVGADSLRDMQRAWIGYRDARCTLDAITYRGGTGAAAGGTECAMRATAEQVFVLRDLRDRLE